MKADAAEASKALLMRYLRLLSELSNRMRYASQKRVLTELALIRLIFRSWWNKPTENLKSGLRSEASLSSPRFRLLPLRSTQMDSTFGASWKICIPMPSNMQPAAPGSMRTWQETGIRRPSH